MPLTALKILILEDNADLLAGWTSFLRAEGHQVRGVALADELLDASAGFSPDVYVIDLNLPDADGLLVVRRLRAVHPDVGIVITTARTQIGDRVLGYDSGADIYFSKPVDPQELMAGICALAKRRHSASGEDDGLCLQLDQHRLTGPAGSADLTPGETTLLAALARAAGQPIARWRIAELTGAVDGLPSEAMVEMRIARLRRKLTAAGAASPSIRAVHKQGYVLSCRVTLQSG